MPTSLVTPRTARCPQPRPLPTAPAPTAYVLPPVLDTVLPSGVRCVALRHEAAPLATVSLALPFAARTRAEAAAAEVLAATLLGGTGDLDGPDLDDLLARSGAAASSGRTHRGLSVGGTAVSSGLGALLGLLGRCLRGARHDDVAVGAAAARLATQAGVLRAQPSVAAGEALLEHLYGELPALADVPDAGALQTVTGADVRALHGRLVRPDGATLVVVSDRPAHEVLEVVAEALAGWTGTAEASGPALPPRRSGGVVAVARPGAPQSQLRLSAPGVGRTDPSFAALTLANLCFGGYFSSRLVTVLREQRGLAYRATSGFSDHLDRLVLGIEVDTATGATRAALEGTLELLAEFSTRRPPSAAEVAHARRYLLGMEVVAVASHAGLAAHVGATVGLGQPPSWLTTFPRQVEATTVDEVAESAAAHYDPQRFAGVVLGDPGVVPDAVAGLR